MSWPGNVIGRDGEFGYATTLLAQLADGPAALVFAGEPGIGKTTVLLAAAERARAFPAVVLSAHPVAAEAELGFAALADLLAPVVDELLPALPEPQRHALAVVLLMEEPGRPLDQRAVCAATLSGLRMAAVRGPVVLAIDDLQWLDASSARMLDFALRRLGGLPVGVVACERAGAGSPPADHAAGVRLDLGRALPAGRCARYVLGPLSLGALQQVLKRELGRSFPHRTLSRIARVAGGNPFYALELARCLPEDVPGAADLTVPEDLRRVVEDRLAGLPGRTREALLLAAVAAAPTVELVSSAASPGTTPEDPIEAAVAAGIVTLEGAQVRFTHPLFAAGLSSSASPGQRRLAHRRLVPLITDIEEQARHRALGAEGPGEGVAGALDAAAEHARRRGAPEVAADLAEHARALTPPHRSPDRQRRTIKAAGYAFTPASCVRAANCSRRCWPRSLTV